MQKIAVTGANGQLGQKLCRRIGAEALPLTRQDLDLSSDNETIRAVLNEMQPSVIFNCAAYTAVDNAEEETELSHRVNGESVAVLAEYCQEHEAKLIQISTDYVFDAAEGRRPWTEQDEPKTVGAYANSKRQGEENAARCERHFIVRTSGLYSLGDDGPVCGRNFVDTMLCLGAERDELSIVNDQYCTPTYVPHLVEALVFLAQTEKYGVYHVTNRDSASWFEFAGELFRQANVDVWLHPISTEEYGAAAPRPRYSVLDNSKFNALGGPRLPSWTSGLADYLQAASELSPS